MVKLAKAVLFKCASGHEQRVTFSPEMSEHEAHDFGVLIAGGTLRSIGRPMPGYPCQWAKDGESPCGARVTFEVEP